MNIGTKVTGRRNDTVASASDNLQTILSVDSNPMSPILADSSILSPPASQETGNVINLLQNETLESDNLQSPTPIHNESDLMSPFSGSSTLSSPSPSQEVGIAMSQNELERYKLLTYFNFCHYNLIILKFLFSKEIYYCSNQAECTLLCIYSYLILYTVVYN